MNHSNSSNNYFNPYTNFFFYKILSFLNTARMFFCYFNFENFCLVDHKYDCMLCCNSYRDDFTTNNHHFVKYESLGCCCGYYYYSDNKTNKYKKEEYFNPVVYYKHKINEDKKEEKWKLGLCCNQFKIIDV